MKWGKKRKTNTIIAYDNQRKTRIIKLADLITVKRKLQTITSGARETGKATVRDSARAGESQQIEAKAVAVAAKPTKPFTIDLTKC